MLGRAVAAEAKTFLDRPLTDLVSEGLDMVLGVISPDPEPTPDAKVEEKPPTDAAEVEQLRLANQALNAAFDRERARADAAEAALVATSPVDPDAIARSRALADALNCLILLERFEAQAKGIRKTSKVSARALADLEDQTQELAEAVSYVTSQGHIFASPRALMDEIINRILIHDRHGLSHLVDAPGDLAEALRIGRESAKAQIAEASTRRGHVAATLTEVQGWRDDILATILIPLQSVHNDGSVDQYVQILAEVVERPKRP